jgi:hypothetical protein
MEGILSGSEGPAHTARSEIFSISNCFIEEGITEWKKLAGNCTDGAACLATGHSDLLAKMKDMRGGGH